MQESRLEVLVQQYAAAPTAKDLRSQMEEAVNELIRNDFSRLVSILYRIDVSEKKLRAELAGQPGQDAATLITGLVLARLEEKRRSREQHRQSGEIPDDEKW